VQEGELCRWRVQAWPVQAQVLLQEAMLVHRSLFFFKGYSVLVPVHCTEIRWTSDFKPGW
jgi:hypothetical protein